MQAQGEDVREGDVLRLVSARPRRPSNARIRAIGETLERVRETCDVAARFRTDPVAFVHRYEDPHDREIVALLASSLAFGNVKTLTAKIDLALTRIGPSPARRADDPARLKAALRGWKHRLYTAGDLAALVVGARRLQLQAGSLGRALRERVDQANGALIPGLAAWATAIRQLGGLDRRRTIGARHILARPDQGSASKRLMLLLRWMVRPADGVDLGMWPLSPSDLVIPLDVHLHRLGRNLGLTTKKSASFAAAADVTRELRRIDPNDPVKYDFPLCHLGMVQRCPSRRDPVRCEGCGVKPICVHWHGAREGSAPEAP